MNMVNKNKYLNRIIDKTIAFKLKTFGAINIVGPKWCGKSATGKHFAKSKIELQQIFNIKTLIEKLMIDPNLVLDGEKPKLIDEWQDAPIIWDAVRNYCDNNSGYGHFILTGSTSKKVETKHTGTGRISTLKMYPMSLYESKESNGTVSLSQLFNSPRSIPTSFKTNLTIKELIMATCRGGWPDSLNVKTNESKLEKAKDYYHQIFESDMFNVDKVRRKPNTMKAILYSYARNVSTLAKKNTILNDVSQYLNIERITLNSYLDILRRLYIIEELDGWSPSIRSASAMRLGPKRAFVDPSIAVAALGASPTSLYNDLNTFGFLFENLCIRDLRVYAQALGGQLKYYRDKTGLEIDCVLTLDDLRYAIIEIKLSSYGYDEAAKHLNKFEELISIKNNQNKIKLPSLKIILTADNVGYKRKDGIYIIPIGCLKD